MNKIITFLCSSIVTIAANSQPTAKIEVSYTAWSPNMKTGKVEVKNQYILLANSSESKFYSPKTEYIDSLNSTPEGVAKYQEMTRNAYFGGKMDELPRKDGSYYILKSFPDKTVKTFDSAGLDKFYYVETPEEWAWEIGDSTKTILGYECVQATTDFHGRKWTVWFTPEIPLQNGPWKFDGLPGLIMEATSDGGEYSFIATGVQQTDKTIIPLYLADSYEKTTRIDFLKNKRAFFDNTLSRINAQLGVSVTKVEDENGNDISGSIFASSDIVDFIETDYK